eukprot:7633676-Lingulodinium_polyedra.AAC.1
MLSQPKLAAQAYRPSLPPKPRHVVAQWRVMGRRGGTTVERHGGAVQHGQWSAMGRQGGTT